MAPELGYCHPNGIEFRITERWACEWKMDLGVCTCFGEDKGIHSTCRCFNKVRLAKVDSGDCIHCPRPCHYPQYLQLLLVWCMTSGQLVPQRWELFELGHYSCVGLTGIELHVCPKVANCFNGCFIPIPKLLPAICCTCPSDCFLGIKLNVQQRTKPLQGL